MTKLASAFLLMMLPVFALADDTGPKTPAVRGVLTKLEKAKADAKAVYDRSVARAVDDARRELEKLKSDVMKRGDLDEANRIAKATESVGTDQPTLSVVGRWQYFPLGNTDSKKTRVLELLDRSSIGQGKSGWEQSWKMEGSNLVLSGDNGDCVLFACIDGSWRGSWKGGGAVTLKPVSSRP